MLVEVLLLSQFIPDFLLARTKGRWLIRLALVIRAFLWIVWPFRVLLEMAISLAHISDEHAADGSTTQQDGIEALVDAAEQEGILERDEAQMIEQVVEFSDKRVLEFMTPRPDVVAISASSTVEQLRKLLIETKFSRVPVYEESLDEIDRCGVCAGLAAGSRRRSPDVARCANWRGPRFLSRKPSTVPSC